MHASGLRPLQEHEFWFPKQRLHKINSYSPAEQTHLSCYSACHSSRADTIQNVRERRRTPGQVAAVRSSSKLDLTASGRVSRLKGLASGDNPVKGRFIHQQAVNAKTSRIVSAARFAKPADAACCRPVSRSGRLTHLLTVTK